MSPRTLAQLDAAQVMVRVSVPVGFELNVASTRLNLQLKGQNGAKTAAMGLTATSVSRTVRSGGLFGSDVPVSTYLLRLTPEGARQLQEAQHFILASQPNHFEFGLNAPFATVPPAAREVTFWADLKLSQSEAFRPLINGAKIQFTAAKAGS
jgi:hypothetical protein